MNSRTVSQLSKGLGKINIVLLWIVLAGFIGMSTVGTVYLFTYVSDNANVIMSWSARLVVIPLVIIAIELGIVTTMGKIVEKKVKKKSEN